MIIINIILTHGKSCYEPYKSSRRKNTLNLVMNPVIMIIKFSNIILTHVKSCYEPLLITRIMKHI